MRYSTITILLLLVPTLILGVVQQVTTGALDGGKNQQNGHFDFYLFVQQWSYTYCTVDQKCLAGNVGLWGQPTIVSPSQNYFWALAVGQMSEIVSHISFGYLYGIKDYKEQKSISKQIEKELKTHKKMMDSELKLLLLGTGDSGKSTIVKQMKILHMKGYSNEDRVNHKSLINRNIIEIVYSLIHGCASLNISIPSRFQKLCETVIDIYEERKYHNMSITIVTDLIDLCKDAAIQSALAHSGSKFQIHSSVEYFIQALPRIAVTETRFNLAGVNFRMIDVGGQRGHRTKWIHHFTDVTALLFVVSLSEFDQVLEEDNKTNRMVETTKVFADMINSKWFTAVPIILFLNKRDLFAAKITKTNLNVCFPDYTGGCNYEEALQFIKKKLLSTNKQPKSIYTHVTAATDTNNVSAVFDAVKDIIVTRTMENGGI
eukprot:gene11573-13506_t